MVSVAVADSGEQVASLAESVQVFADALDELLTRSWVNRGQIKIMVNRGQIKIIAM